jgi:hypothetical protein
MTVSSASKSAPSWKDYFLKTKQASYSNFLLAKIRDSVNPPRPFLESNLEISKNPGIALLSMDASEEKLQLFHSVSIIGGSWTDNKVRLVGALGSADEIVPLQIMTNSIKEVKGKSHSFNQLVTKIKLNESWEPDRAAKADFHNFNILPIPALLSQVFLSLENLDPLSVASAFFQAMYVFDNDDDDYFNNESDHEETSECELSLDPEVATLFGREIGQSSGDILLTICDDSKDKIRSVTCFQKAIYNLFYV